MLRLLDIKINVKRIRNGKVVIETMSLPEYTAADEGKVLSIVDGQLGWVAAPNSPIAVVESVDESNLVNLRDLESGTYILYGYFKPYPGAPETVSYDNALVGVARLSAGSHLMVYTPLNFKLYCEEILVDSSTERGFTYKRDIVSLLDLSGLVDRVAALEGGA